METHGCEVDIHIGMQDSIATIRFTIANNTDSVLGIKCIDLPWIGRNALIVAVDARSDTQILERYRMLINPGSGEISIGAHSLVHHEESLYSMFPQMKSILTQSDCVVFWSARVVSSDGSIDQRFGNWILVPGFKKNQKGVGQIGNSGQWSGVNE